MWVNTTVEKKFRILDAKSIDLHIALDSISCYVIVYENDIDVAWKKS